jgi:hypothetical protein
MPREVNFWLFLLKNSLWYILKLALENSCLEGMGLAIKKAVSSAGNRDFLGTRGGAMASLSLHFLATLANAVFLYNN